MSRTLLACLLVGAVACDSALPSSPALQRSGPDANADVVPVQWYMPATLTVPRGWVGGAARAINTSGAIVGFLRTSSGSKVAVRWAGATGSVSLLAIPRGFSWGEAEGINDAGLIVGSAGPDPWSPTAMRWDATSTTKLPDSGDGGEAFDVNASGTIAGNVRTSAGHPVPAMWSAAGTLSVLPFPAGYHRGSVVAINASGTMVGWVAQTTTRRAYLWNAGGGGGTFVGSVFTGKSEATDITDAGRVTVWGGLDPVYSAGTTDPPYTTVNILWSGSAVAISSKGRIIGEENSFHAKTWLNTPWPLGWPGNGVSGSVDDVNICGTIVGYVSSPNWEIPGVWTKASCDP